MHIFAFKYFYWDVAYVILILAGDEDRARNILQLLYPVESKMIEEKVLDLGEWQNFTHCCISV